jgi:hypothetical protein
MVLGLFIQKTRRILNYGGEARKIPIFIMLFSKGSLIIFHARKTTLDFDPSI